MKFASGVARCDFRRRVLRCHARYAGKGHGALRSVTRDFRVWHLSDMPILPTKVGNRFAPIAITDAPPIAALSCADGPPN